MSRYGTGRLHADLRDLNSVIMIEAPPGTGKTALLLYLLGELSARRARRRCERILDAWSSVLPARIANEQIGDYLEDINRRIGEGQRASVCIRLMAAIFWTGLNAIGYALKQLGRTKSGA